MMNYTLKKQAAADALTYAQIDKKMDAIPGYFDEFAKVFREIDYENLKGDPTKSSHKFRTTVLVLGLAYGVHKQGIDVAVVRATRKKAGQARVWIKEKL